MRRNRGRHSAGGNDRRLFRASGGPLGKSGEPEADSGPPTVAIPIAESAADNTLEQYQTWVKRLLTEQGVALAVLQEHDLMGEYRARIPTK